MKYDEVNRIESKATTAWLIILPSGEKRIEVWTVEAQVKDVHLACLAHYKKFKLQRIDVGSFIISKVDSSYTGDARRVDQDYEMGL